MTSVDAIREITFKMLDLSELASATEELCIDFLIEGKLEAADSFLQLTRSITYEMLCAKIYVEEGLGTLEARHIDERGCPGCGTDICVCDD